MCSCGEEAESACFPSYQSKNLHRFIFGSPKPRFLILTSKAPQNSVLCVLPGTVSSTSPEQPQTHGPLRGCSFLAMSSLPPLRPCASYALVSPSLT